jgi:hypothetical protein
MSHKQVHHGICLAGVPEERITLWQRTNDVVLIFLSNSRRLESFICYIVLFVPLTLTF